MPEQFSLPSDDAWQVVELDGVLWKVAPTYLAPVAIGQAKAFAESVGCKLPTPALVDAIWRASDLRVAPLPQPHDGSIAGMTKAYARQEERIAAQLAGRDFRLVAGTHKDVCEVNGKLGLYGWHRLDGSVIQPFFAGHLPTWIDGSQGLRLCMEMITT